MTPLGALVFAPFFEHGNEQLISAATALTAGTFMYVSIGELLPEVFHTKQNRWLKLLLMIIGIAIMGLFGHSLESGHTH